MGKAEWSYQVAPAGAPATGLEEYVVEATSGERVGKVQALLRRGDELFLAVERGNPPLTHDVRAFPWSEVERVDHTHLVVYLRLDERGIEEGLELDPDRGVEDGEADAVRVTELPAELRQPAATGQTTGPVDRPTWVAAVALAAAGLLSALVVVMALAAADEADWLLVLFTIPVGLFLAAGVAAYRVFRNPYEPR